MLAALLIAVTVLGIYAMYSLQHVTKHESGPTVKISAKVAIEVWRGGKLVQRVIKYEDIATQNLVKLLALVLSLGTVYPKNMSGLVFRAYPDGTAFDMSKELYDLGYAVVKTRIVASNGTGTPAPTDYNLFAKYLIEIEPSNLAAFSNLTHVWFTLSGQAYAEVDASISEVGLVATVDVYQLETGAYMTGFDILLTHDVLPTTVYVRAGDVVKIEYTIYVRLR